MVNMKNIKPRIKTRILYNTLAEIKAFLNECGIIVHFCTKNTCKIKEDYHILGFTIRLPKATTAEAELAIELVHHIHPELNHIILPYSEHFFYWRTEDMLSLTDNMQQ